MPAASVVSAESPRTATEDEPIAFVLPLPKLIRLLLGQGAQRAALPKSPDPRGDDSAD